MSRSDERVLVLAPIGEDAQLICEQLAGVGLEVSVYRDLSELADSMLEGAAAALIAEEALDEQGIGRLLQVLSAQPAWSDFPITILAVTDAYEEANGHLFRTLAESVNLTLLERPLRVVTLIMTVQAAVRARRRQYEFRDYLKQYEQYQEQIRHTQKLESLGVLAGGIAHDFNNLLTGILGNISLVADSMSPADASHRLLQDAIAATERAAKLTGQMLAYSGKGSFLVRPLNISNVVRRLDDFFRASIPKRVDLRLELAADPPALEGDESQLEQVVMNLVLNAAEAIPENRPGHVTVATGAQELKADTAVSGIDGTPLRPGTYARLQVADDGAGMDNATLARIFDPFFTTKFVGRGLGLAAVHGVIRGHGGGIRVESQPGRGTTVTVLFPAYEPKPRAASPTGSDRSQRLTTVLVVDDEEIVRRTATSVLEKNGFSVISAENGQVAIDIMKKACEQIDVVLLDLAMPVMDGEQTFQALQALRPGIRVVLSSGYEEAEAVRRFSRSGLAGFIQKPYTNKRLVESVKRAIGSATSERGA
jgi:signal transduction histidine kinase/ActR/RegA family two-component response regulator